MKKRFLTLLVLLGGLLAITCAKPTEIVVETYSEVDCSRRPQIALVGGAGFSDLKTNAPSAFAQQCEPGVQRRGSIVIQPSGNNDSTIAFQILTRNDDAAPDIACNPDDGYKGCIVSRRRLRFAPHDTIHLRIDLRLSCLDKPCGEDETCVRGGCFQATIPDDCNADDCNEDALLGGQSPPDLDAGDGAPAADTGAPDADAGSVVCPVGLTLCGTQCLDLNSSQHCGSCSSPGCPGGTTCVAGACKATCGANGSNCTSAGQCCSLFCNTGTSMCATCPLLANGATCAIGTDCCSGQCSGVATCCNKGLGQGCTGSDVCCVGSCSGGTCQ
jgi:hypothetical protein